MTGKEFKDNLDDVVERLLKKLDKKTFMEVMPDQADKVFLDGLHSRMVSVMRNKLGQNVEEMLERDDVLGKLDQLRDITSKTQQPPGHQAWRPNGNPEDAMAALDLQVAERELEELRVVGQALNSEMEQMEEKLNAAKKREELNQEALSKSVRQLDEINLRLSTFSN